MGDTSRQEAPHCRSPYPDGRNTYPVSAQRPSRAAGLVALMALGLGAAGIGADESRTYPPLKGIAELTGIALQADGETPWAKATVELWWYADAAEDSLPTAPDTGSGALWEARVDGRGAFAFDGSPPGRFWLRVSTLRRDTEYTASVERSLRVDIAPGEQARAIEVVMDDLELRGQVLLYADGPPAADAEVTLIRMQRRGGAAVGGYGVAFPQTNTIGGFAVRNLEPGEYSIRAETPGPAEGYGEAGQISVVIPEEGLTEPVTVLLQPYTLRGTVRQADGSPAAEALVVLGRIVKFGVVLVQPPESGPHVLVTHTDAEGAFEFPHVGRGENGHYWLYARGPDGQERTQPLTFEQGKPPQAQELRLTRCTIEGRLTRAADGEPVADAEVGQCDAGVRYKQSWGPFWAVTDADGRFRLPGCDPGEYELTAESEHIPLARALVTAEAGQPVQATLTIANTHVIGVVVRPDGEPVSGAQVLMERRHAETDGEGRFEFRQVLPGKQRLSIRAANGRQARGVEVTVDDASPTRLEVVLPTFKPKVVLAVRKPNGEPAGGLQAYGYFHYEGLSATGGGPNAYRLDADGKCDFDVEGECKAWFMLMVPGLGCSEPGEVTVTGLEPEVEQIVRLELAGSISGVVREEGTGRPIGGVMITPWQVAAAAEKRPAWDQLYYSRIGVGDEAVFPATASRDGDGTFTIEPLPAATYELEVWDLFGHNHKVPVTLGRQQHLEGLEMTVPHEDQAATVSGAMLDSEGRPVKSREVALRIWRTWSASWKPTAPEFSEGIGKLRRVVTDEEGRFTLDPMPRGRWLIVPGERMQVGRYGVVVSLDGGSVTGVTIKLPPEDG